MRLCVLSGEGWHFLIDVIVLVLLLFTSLKQLTQVLHKHPNTQHFPGSSLALGSYIAWDQLSTPSSVMSVTLGSSMSAKQAH